MSRISNGLIQFEDYEVDRTQWRLSYQGEVLQLNPKTFDLLLYLLDNSERVIGKEELLRALWPESFVEESNLTQHVFLLRKALSRHSSGRKIIDTVPGRGYRFAAAISGGHSAQTEVVIRATESVTRITVAEEEFEEPESASLASVAEPPLLTDGQTARRRKAWYYFARIILPASVAIAAVSLAAVVWLARQPHLHVADEVRITHDGVSKRFYGLYSTLVTDGKRLVFIENADKRSMLAEVPIDGGEVSSIPAPFADVAIADYSDVNRRLLVGSVWRTDDERPILTGSLPGSNLVQIGELTGHDASWSVDARSIAIAKGRYLYTADADGSNERRIVSAAGIVYSPRWSPDGKVIRFSENLGSNENRLWEVDRSGANLHRLLADDENGEQVCCGSWAADGGNFFYLVPGIVSTSIWVLPPPQGTWFRKPRPIRLTVGMSDVWQSPLSSRDGRSLWAVGSHLRGELMTVDPATRSPQSYLGGISAEGVNYSPDRSWIVYTAYPEGTLWRSRPDGSEKEQLTTPPLVARFPQWSPDGSTIAFMASQSGSMWRIYLVPASGGTPRLMLDDNTAQGVPNWSPDGKQIVFGKLLDYGNERDPNLTIEFYDLERHSHKTLHGSEGMWTPRWSPDGRFLTAVTQDNQILRLYDTQSQQWSDLSNVGVNDVIWSRDSRYLYFDTIFGGDPTLYRIPMDTRKLERWAELRGFHRGGFYGPWLGITPDGAPLLLKDTSLEEIYRLDLATSN